MVIFKHDIIVITIICMFGKFAVNILIIVDY